MGLKFKLGDQGSLCEDCVSEPTPERLKASMFRGTVPGAVTANVEAGECLAY